VNNNERNTKVFKIIKNKAAKINYEKYTFSGGLIINCQHICLSIQDELSSCASQ
jgi:hypothetical protein